MTEELQVPEDFQRLDIEKKQALWMNGEVVWSVKHAD